MKGTTMIAALAAAGLMVSPVFGQNLLTNGDFEASPPNDGWSVFTDFDRPEHQPGGGTPSGSHYGSVQAGGSDIVRLGNHAPVATSGVGAKNVTLTGFWGAGTTCSGPNSGQPCNNLVVRSPVVRVHDGDALGPIAAEEKITLDSGIGEDPLIPNGLDWTPFTIAGTVSSGQATVEFGWVDGNGQWSDGTATHADALDLREGTVTADLTLIGATSKRTHGAAGVFGLDAPLAAPHAIEPRQNGATPVMTLSFDGVPVATDGTVNCGQEIIVANGTCNSAVVNGNDIDVSMTFDKNQCVTVSVSGLNGLTGDTDVSVIAHEGNVNGVTGVNILDLTAVKNSLLQGVNIINFLNDVNVSGGSINILDLTVTKNNLFVPAGACP